MRFEDAMIPGERLPGALTRSAAQTAMAAHMPAQPGTMDAAVTAERQREGGGAPGQRRPGGRRWPWSRVRIARERLVAPKRTFFGWPMRTNHV
jgi:hypothetical protein